MHREETKVSRAIVWLMDKLPLFVTSAVLQRAAGASTINYCCEHGDSDC